MERIDALLERADPLLVIGMHRSGTRLLVKVLERLGVFMGADRQADAESVTFMLINEGILHQCGAFWSEPMSAHFTLSQPEAVESLAAGVKQTLAAHIAQYTGRSGGLRGAAPGVEGPFGWKDPRNTFTLPVWKQIFPKLRAIHIVRHGVDVAHSLARRHAEALRSATGEAVPPALTVIRDHALGILSSRRGWTLAEAFTMWEQYVEKARLEGADLGDRAMEVRFEDLLMQPDQVVSAIAKFCEVAAPRERTALLDDLKPGRAFAFRKDPELVAFAEDMQDTLRRYGYSP